MRRFFPSLLLILLLAFSAPVAGVRAEGQAMGFSISPFFQEISIGKDQTSAPFSVAVRNTTNAPVVFRLSVLDFGTLDESGGVAFLGASDNLKYSLASWVSLPDDTLVLPPGEARTVTGAIENRESLSPGGHYGALFFKIEEDGGGDSSQKIAFDPSFASLLFVRKIGGETYGLNLNRIDFPVNRFTVPDALKLRFQNTGNVHVTPRGTAEVTDPLGRLVLKSVVNGESGIVLPESFRVFPGKFFPVAPLLVPGRYILSVAYRYDGRDDFVTERRSFVLIPPLFLLAFGATLAGAGGAFVWLRNKRRLYAKKSKTA